ncbi:MAG: AMP-binding protein [Gemmatimonadetes bacterium]|nr:AMP-binding protein [Gemmatimonadota bacterium]
MLNAAVLAEHGAGAHPGRLALVFEGRTLTYGALDAAVNRAANGLRAAGFGPGDHIALCCPNRPEFVIAYYAVLKLGATVVTISALSKRREIAYYLGDSDARALIAYAGRDGSALGRDAAAAFAEVTACTHLWLIPDGGDDTPPDGARPFGELLANQATAFDMAPTPADATATILYTSGTMGQPKGAELTHSNIVMNVVVTSAIFPERDNQIQLVALPLFHVYAQTCLMHMGLHGGDTLVLMQRFEAGAALALMSEAGVTRFAGVPTMYQAFLEHPDFDERRPPKERVLGIPFENGGGIAFPFLALDSGDARRVVQETTDSGPVVVFWDRDLAAAVAFRPAVEGQSLSFEVVDGRYVDVETGSEWTFEGVAVSGAMEGAKLVPFAEAYVSFWFAWSTFVPDTQLWLP